MNYKETIKQKIDILSESLRSFVLNENWRREAEKIGKQFNFDEEKYASFENEIFLVLLCFEPKSDFAENIKTELGIDANEAGWIAEEVEKNIFSQVSAEIDSMWQTAEKETPAQSKVGSDFEQIILNQARAMQPAQPADSGIINHESRIMEEKKDETSRIIHNYVGSNDPYREPIN